MMTWVERGTQRRSRYLLFLQKYYEKSDWTWWGAVVLGVRENAHLQSSVTGGQSWYRGLCNKGGGLNGRSQTPVPQLSSEWSFVVNNGDSSSSEGLTGKELASEGERAEWWGRLRLSSVQTTSYSSRVLRSQPIQFTYIWLPLSKMHTLDDTICSIRFTNILPWCSKEEAKYLRHMRFMASY